jgi:protein PhnA
MNPACPKCKGDATYEDAGLWICPLCAHEWSVHAPAEKEKPEEESLVVRDANGNVLKDGDSVTVIKDLKVKGSSSALKSGTKVKSIRLVESSDGHNIDCKIDGFGAMRLKSEFVKKA